MPRSRDEDEFNDDEEYERPSRRRAARDDDEDERPSKRSTSSRRSADDDDDEDETPRRRAAARRSRDDDDDEDERPAKRSARRRDDDDDDEDERPAKRSARKRDDDDDDDDRPSKRSSRRRDDDDDEDEAPKRSSRRRSRDDDDDDDEPVKAKVKGGWSEAKRLKDESSTFTQSLKLTGEDTIVKFLDDDPYANFAEHWVDQAKGKKSWTCLKGLDSKGCPLCAVGLYRRSKFCFNVVAYESEDGGKTGEWVLRSFEVGVTVLEQLSNYNKDKRNGPLTKAYWAMRRTGKGKQATTNITPVKEDDLRPDWSIKPLTDKQLDSFDATKYTSASVQIPSRRDLQELADEIDD